MEDISILMIASNEEEKILKSLQSVSWAKEIIIIIDEKSLDATEKIALNNGAKVYKNKWAGYASQKNFGLTKAKCEWVLDIGADEFVTPELADEIKKLKPTKDGYKIPFRTFFKTKWLRFGGLYPQYHVRLFKKELANFVGQTGGQIHEGVKIKNVGKLNNAINHYTWDNINDMWSKAMIYSNVEANEIVAIGKTPSNWDYIKILWIFFKRYFLLKGILDGWYGFNYAFISSLYELRKVIIWERMINRI